jgi:hypothetical protein
MIDRTARITLNIPGDNRYIAIDVLLADIARKLREVGSLKAGEHEIIVFGDGSIVLDSALAWEPKASNVAPQQPKKRKVA